MLLPPQRSVRPLVATGSALPIPRLRRHVLRTVLPLRLLLDDALEHDRRIVLRVPGSEDEGHVATPNRVDQPRQHGVFLGCPQLRLVPAAELLPARRVMPEPATQLRAGRQIL